MRRGRKRRRSSSWQCGGGVFARRPLAVFAVVGALLRSRRRTYGQRRLWGCFTLSTISERSTTPSWIHLENTGHLGPIVIASSASYLYLLIMIGSVLFYALVASNSFQQIFSIFFFFLFFLIFALVFILVGTWLALNDERRQVAA